MSRREGTSSIRQKTDLDVDLVTTQHDGNVFTNTLQVSMPVRNVLVGDSGSNIEHDDSTLTCLRRDDAGTQAQGARPCKRADRYFISNYPTHPGCSIRLAILRTSLDQRCPNS